MRWRVTGIGSPAGGLHAAQHAEGVPEQAKVQVPRGGGASSFAQAAAAVWQYAGLQRGIVRRILLGDDTCRTAGQPGLRCQEASQRPLERVRVECRERVDGGVNHAICRKERGAG